MIRFGFAKRQSPGHGKRVGSLDEAFETAGQVWLKGDRAQSAD